MEHDAINRRTRAERVSNLITKFVGSMGFLLAQVISSDRRSHLDLQVGMLSEQELTTILQMPQKLCQHVGVDVDASKHEIQSFSETTDVHELASELEDKLPEE